MKKRLLALICAAALILTLAACGNGGSAKKNTSGPWKVGICQLVTHPALDAATQGFKDALSQTLGEDKVTFDEQNAAGDTNTCATIVNAFVADNVDLIMANATPSLASAAAATSEIPILGTSITEYGVALEIADFNGTVGGNISGTSDLAPLDKQAAMIKEWFPDAQNVGLLYCSAEPNSLYQVNTVQKELEKMGCTCTQYAFADSNDLSAVAQSAVDASDVIYVPTDNTVASNAGILDGIARGGDRRVPVIAGEESICKGCGVATLTISYYDLGVATGKMAAKVLKGESDISKMPIEYAAEFTPKYNQAICEDLGLTPPQGYEAIESEVQPR